MEKILAIDDNTDNLTILKVIVNDTFPGSTFYSALNGAKGIELAIEMDPDVILLDILMPVMDGFEVCRCLKHDHRVMDIPVVFLTALRGDKENRIRALEMGAEAFLTKPIDKTELIAQIRAMIKIKSAVLQKRNEQERLERLVSERTAELEQNQVEMTKLLNDLKAENKARSESEVALRESEQKYRQLYESAGVGIGYYTTEGKVISFNKIAAMNLNGEPDSFIGKSIDDLFPPTMAELFLKRINDATISENVLEYEDCFTFPDGIKWFHNILSRIKNSKNELLGIQVISSDITRRKKTEESLRLNESRLNRAELISKSGNWELHLETRKMIASAGASEIYGLNDEQFDIEFVKNFPLSEYRPLLDSAMQKLLNGHQSYDIEFKIKTAETGEIKDIRSVATYDHENGIVYGIIQDITARKQVESALRMSEILNRNLVEHLPQRVFIKDINSNYISCNANYANDLGIAPEEIIGKDDFEFVPAEMALAYRSDDQIVMSTGKSKKIIEPYLVKGEKFWIQTTKVPYHNEKGEISGVLGIFEDITEQKKSEEALQNSEERFKNIYAKSPIAIELYNEKGRLIDVNPACCALFGIQSANDVQGFLLFDDPNIPQDKKELLKKGHSIRYESDFDFDLVKKFNLYQSNRSGKVSLDVLITPIRKSEQPIFDYLVQIIDITKRKQTEKALLAEQARINAITMAAQDAILMMDPKGDIQFFNPAAERIFGYLSQDVIGRNLHILLAPQQYHNAHLKAFKQFLKTGFGNAIGKNLELEAYCKDGRTINVELSLSGLELADGWYSVGIIRDITEKKAMEKKVKLLAHSLVSISECVSITDNDDYIIYINDSLLNTYGYSEDELIGKHISILRMEEQSDVRVRDIFMATIDGGWRGEIFNKRKDGTIFPVLLSTSIIKDEHNEQIAMIGVAIDISEIRKNREELIAAKEKAEEGNRLKTAFLATMNHELRTPLNHILGFSDLIMSGGKHHENYKYASFIHESGKNLLAIVEDIFNLAMVEQANIKVRNQTFSLFDHFEEIKASFDEILKNSSKHDQIQLIFNPDIDHLLDFIITDKSKINQVLSNLFKNAVKFSQQGTIEFGYRIEDKTKLSFYVKDTGIGIPKDKQTIIFDFFRQVDDSITRSYGGVGVGLAISLKIAKILHGELSVVSEPGKGSTFTFTIPVGIAKV